MKIGRRQTVDVGAEVAAAVVIVFCARRDDQKRVGSVAIKNTFIAKTSVAVVRGWRKWNANVIPVFVVRGWRKEASVRRAAECLQRRSEWELFRDNFLGSSIVAVSTFFP